jgi:hypothetical protein
MKLDYKKMSKKAQAESIIIFFVLMVAILIVSIIVLRLTNSIITPFSAQLNNSGNPVMQTASQAVNYAQSKFSSTWDWAIILILLVNLLILFISSFMIDIHPAFVIIYIFAGIFLFIFGNFALGALDAIWGGVGTAVETAQTPLEQFIINNFQYLMIGIYVVTGIIIYAKIKLFGGQGAGGSY